MAVARGLRPHDVQMFAADAANGTHPLATEPDIEGLRSVVDRRRRRANQFIEEQAECEDFDDDEEEVDEEDLSILREFIDEDNTQDSVDFYARINRVLDEVNFILV